jgi:hypothetical protein
LYQTFLRDSSLFALLLRFDQDLAEQARQKGCSCGGVLHSARYPRKPRGGPAQLGPEFGRRDSFCCSVEGCRRRVTPPSLRFLGRKVFFAVWVLLLPVLREGPNRWSQSRIQEIFAVSARTLRRWQRWWREILPPSRFFQARRGDWARPLAAESLPGSLLAAFGSHPPGERVQAVLRWLAPLSRSSERAL